MTSFFSWDFFEDIFKQYWARFCSWSLVHEVVVLYCIRTKWWRGAVQRSPFFFQALLSGQEEDTVLPELSWLPLFPSFLCVMHQALHWSDAFTLKITKSWKVFKPQLKWNWRLKWNNFPVKLAISWSDMTLWAQMFSVQLPF